MSRALWLALLAASAAAAPGGMLRVPAGELLLGYDEPHPDAGPLPEKAVWPEDILRARAAEGWGRAEPRRAAVRAFRIDRNEVTNAQYAEFLAAITKSGDHGRCHPEEPKGKDHTPRYWKEYNPLLRDRAYARTAPFGPGTFRKPELPVVGVDWYDAYAYAAWAGKRLPTEAEWELACRGTDGRRWPWGNAWAWGLANTGGEKKGRDVWTRGFEKDGFIYPAPVGSFPRGAGPYGCLDMAGNAAEWTADRHGALRSVRGGSSASYPSGARCAARVPREPGFRNFDLGFRCAGDL